MTYLRKCRSQSKHIPQKSATTIGSLDHGRGENLLDLKPIYTVQLQRKSCLPFLSLAQFASPNAPSYISFCIRYYIKNMQDFIWILGFILLFLFFIIGGTTVQITYSFVLFLTEDIFFACSFIVFHTIGIQLSRILPLPHRILPAKG